MTMRSSPLDPTTWEAFAQLAERHKRLSGTAAGVRGFHPACAEKGQSREGQPARTRSASCALGRRMRHWCSTVRSPWPGANTVRRRSFPQIYHLKQYNEGLEEPASLPASPCFFVRQGLQAQGCRGRVALAWGLGPDLRGKVVAWWEAYPQDTQGKKLSASFLYNGTAQALFEKGGFQYQRPKGKKPLCDGARPSHPASGVGAQSPVTAR